MFRHLYTSAVQNAIVLLHWSQPPRLPALLLAGNMQLMLKAVHLLLALPLRTHGPDPVVTTEGGAYMIKVPAHDQTLLLTTVQHWLLLHPPRRRHLRDRAGLSSEQAKQTKKNKVVAASKMAGPDR
jgi:hypothetical protein